MCPQVSLPCSGVKGKMNQVHHYLSRTQKCLFQVFFFVFLQRLYGTTECICVVDKVGNAE